MLNDDNNRNMRFSFIFLHVTSPCVTSLGCGLISVPSGLDPGAGASNASPLWELWHSKCAKVCCVFRKACAVSWKRITISHDALCSCYWGGSVEPASSFWTMLWSHADVQMKRALSLSHGHWVLEAEYSLKSCNLCGRGFLPGMIPV